MRRILIIITIILTLLTVGLAPHAALADVFEEKPDYLKNDEWQYLNTTTLKMITCRKLINDLGLFIENPDVMNAEYRSLVRFTLETLKAEGAGFKISAPESFSEIQSEHGNVLGDMIDSILIPSFLYESTLDSTRIQAYEQNLLSLLGYLDVINAKLDVLDSAIYTRNTEIKDWYLWNKQFEPSDNDEEDDNTSYQDNDKADENGDKTDSTTTQTNSSGNGDDLFDFCFIATAAYGTPQAEEINVLRHFRDQYLMDTSLGRKLVDYYYTVSPPIAQYISEHEILRILVRDLLISPVVGFVEATQNCWAE